MRAEALSGESLALLSALCYGLGGAAIGNGARTAQGDNGVFLSICVTVVVSSLVWLIAGASSLGSLNAPALLWFMLGGIASLAVGRWAMYRSIALIGVLRASLYRRLIPVFSVVVGALLLAQFPELPVFAGGALILAAVVWGAGPAGKETTHDTLRGHAIALLAAVAYAVAYGVRSLGLEHLPDPALGTCIGALTGVLWFLGKACLQADRQTALHRLVVDRGPWHWLTALSLSAGQTLQFFALACTDIAVVAILGALDTVFTLLLAGYVLRSVPPAGVRLWLACALCLAGTWLVVR